jgi:NAD(P)H-dependent FMN reductase
LLQAISQRWDADIPMNAELRAEALQSASLLQEFHDADVIVLGAPMHNFLAPSTLKVWMDRLLELQGTTTGEPRRTTRLLLVTAGCGVPGGEATEELMRNYTPTEGRLRVSRCQPRGRGARPGRPAASAGVHTGRLIALPLFIIAA